ncbi:LON peptidase substrate-binding domain-containing protein [Alteromonas oceanisediminis]|uniref:LON peptidase substrate-binding domain-containing protein n=1 Tax=Alteromonas oceanisediminis TaxID=2836180 RepID=UPI001BDAD7DE|nr:LON peptidase substrate-binding domain-containing protein [Alteromonas oceanisediminis]MBT0585833.1 LON peptidase substrate-binding domain-containing protein [Alteromonas oceanisediminis]
MQTLPLFPLSAHLLPGGRMALRIFEPRYTRMVKEVCASDGSFVICMLNARGNKENNTHIHSIGTRSKVIDFDILEDGLLGITVEGVEPVRVTAISTENDGLRVGQCDKLTDWEIDIDDNIEPMDSRLKEIFEKYPEVNGLYSSPQFDNPIWVIRRWLELLPVDAQQKQKLLEEKDCSQALSFLRQLIE